MSSISKKDGLTIRIPGYTTIGDWATLTKSLVRMHALASTCEDICLEPGDHYEFIALMDQLLDLQVNDLRVNE